MIAAIVVGVDIAKELYLQLPLEVLAETEALH